MHSDQFSDGSAGDTNYGEVGIDYARYRQPDPAIAQHILAAIGDAHTVHQWSDLGAGIGELVRVTRGPIVILTSDPAALHHYWLADYLPELLEIETRRFPAIDTIASLLGGSEIWPCRPMHHQPPTPRRPDSTP